jgi:hypothetical protein
MTAREIKIARRLLDYLHSLDGGQAHALTIHAEIGGLSFCTGEEFDAVLAELDRNRWVSGVKTEFKGVLWSITDLGESKRNKM